MKVLGLSGSLRSGQADDAFDADRLADPDLELALSNILAELTRDESLARRAA